MSELNAVPAPAVGEADGSAVGAPATRPTWSALTVGAAAAAIVLLGAGVVLPYGVAGANPPLVLVVATAVVTLAGWMWRWRSFGRRSTTWVAVLLGVASLGLGVVAVVSVVEQYADGFPSLRSVVLSVGSVAGLVAALLSLRGGDPEGRGRPPVILTVRAVGGIVATVAVAALAAGGIARLLESSVLTHSTSSAAEVAAMPEGVSRVGWTTELPWTALELSPGGPGAIVRFADGVAAVDGVTGEVRWEYRRSGTPTERLHVSPDGATVLVDFRLDGEREVLVGLDGSTGEHRFSRGDGNGWPYLAVSNEVFAVDDWRDAAYVGYSVASGDEVWRHGRQSGCDRIPGDTGIGVPDGVIVPCPVFGDDDATDGSTNTFVLVDSGGQIGWTVDVGERVPSTLGQTMLSPDGQLVRLQADYPPYHEERGQDDLIVEAHTGAVVGTASFSLSLGFGGDTGNWSDEFITVDNVFTDERREVEMPAADPQTGWVGAGNAVGLGLVPGGVVWTEPRGGEDWSTEVNVAITAGDGSTVVIPVDFGAPQPTGLLRPYPELVAGPGAWIVGHFPTPGLIDDDLDDREEPPTVLVGLQ